MPGGDQPGSSGIETPNRKNSEGLVETISEEKEKVDLASDRDSSKSVSSPSHESESESRMQSPDLTPDCSSSLLSGHKERSTSIEGPSEDIEMHEAITDSETSKSDAPPTADIDLGFELQSPDSKTDSSLSPTSDHKRTGEAKAKTQLSPVDVDKSCPDLMVAIKQTNPPTVRKFETGDTVHDINEPEVELQDTDMESQNVPTSAPTSAPEPPADPSRINRIRNIICCHWQNRYDKYWCGLLIAIVLLFIIMIIVIIVVTVDNLTQYFETLPNGTLLPEGAFIPIEMRALYNTTNYFLFLKNVSESI